MICPARSCECLDVCTVIVHVVVIQCHRLFTINIQQYTCNGIEIIVRESSTYPHTYTLPHAHTLTHTHSSVLVQLCSQLPQTRDAGQVTFNTTGESWED